MQTSTAVQAACRSVAVRTPSTQRTQAVPAVISVARSATSRKRAATYLPPFRRSRANASRRRSSSPLSAFASTIPLTSSSTDPWQKRSMICRTARAARLRDGSVARYVRPSLRVVAQIPFLLESTQQRANGRLLQIAMAGDHIVDGLTEHGPSPRRHASPRSRSVSGAFTVALELLRCVMVRCVPVCYCRCQEAGRLTGVRDPWLGRRWQTRHALGIRCGMSRLQRHEHECPGNDVGASDVGWSCNAAERTGR